MPNLEHIITCKEFQNVFCSLGSQVWLVSYAAFFPWWMLFQGSAKDFIGIPALRVNPAIHSMLNFQVQWMCRLYAYRLLTRCFQLMPEPFPEYLYHYTSWKAWFKSQVTVRRLVQTSLITNFPGKPWKMQIAPFQCSEEPKLIKSLCVKQSIWVKHFTTSTLLIQGSTVGIAETRQ